ncbi:MAG TPA: hypothetical protein VGI32_04275 [Steroidobacteraceae bacterium]
MNVSLSEHQIRSTCRELLQKHGAVSGRGLRLELRKRFGAVGKTARVFEIWRHESRARENAAHDRVALSAIQERLAAAETEARENLERAERAELREQAHQDRWAMQIDRLRQELQSRPKYAAEIRALQEQVLRLTAELSAARSEGKRMR